MSGYILRATSFLQLSPSDTQDGELAASSVADNVELSCSFWLENYNGSEEWSIGNPFTTNEFQILDRSTGTGGGVLAFQSVHGGDTSIGAAGNINFFGTSIGTLAPHIINGGGFYQASTAVPALTVNTGTHYEDIYTCGANCLAIGGATTTTGIPATAIAQFSESLGLTMTLPITLPSDPTLTLQAATKHYVDTGLAAKADLVSSLVPAAELGTGTPTVSTCLLGNGTWGACGTGSMVYPSGAGLAVTTGRPGAQPSPIHCRWRMVARAARQPPLSGCNHFLRGGCVREDLRGGAESERQCPRGSGGCPRIRPGTQACASNPFGSVTVPVKFLFAGATYNTTVQWNLCNGCVAEGSVNRAVVVCGDGIFDGRTAIQRMATPPTLSSTRDSITFNLIAATQRLQLATAFRARHRRRLWPQLCPGAELQRGDFFGVR